MSLHRVALRTMPYPDITLVGLGVEWAQRYPHDFELITRQKTANSHHIGHMSNICSKLKLPLI